ncbi:50S ribosomal protein L15 [Deltaproteobacteria bacterium]|nr:50S ribosomal protein L15 [Deltaproteobacteria bacterium]
MRLNDLSPMKGSKKRRKRVGRGPGSGHGKTSCRGSKGQKSRSGGSIRPGFEGGQMPLQRRLPKRGFTNIFKREYELINIRDLKRFDPDSTLDIDALENAGLIKGSKNGVKLLGGGEISHALAIKVHKVSKKAREKVEAAGGKVELI